jgi:hypothetical protein
MTLAIGQPRSIFTGKGRNIMLVLHKGYAIKVTVKVVDKDGSPTETTNPLVWSYTGDPIGLIPDHNGLGCSVVNANTVGSSVVTVSDGTLSASLDFELKANEPVALILTAGDEVKTDPIDVVPVDQVAVSVDVPTIFV